MSEYVLYDKTEGTVLCCRERHPHESYTDWCRRPFHERYVTGQTLVWSDKEFPEGRRRLLAAGAEVFNELAARTALKEALHASPRHGFGGLAVYHAGGAPGDRYLLGYAFGGVVVAPRPFPPADLLRPCPLSEDSPASAGPDPAVASLPGRPDSLWIRYAPQRDDTGAMRQRCTWLALTPDVESVGVTVRGTHGRETSHTVWRAGQK